MDMQGTPIGSTNQGMKNTSDPERHQNPTQESAGAIASDSLAAESARSGGAFSLNRNSEPQSVSGSNSTFANTDTSGATTLAPARDAAEREAKAGSSEAANQANGPGGQKYPEAAGKAEFPGAHSAGGYAGGPTSAKQETSSGDSIYQTSGSGSTGGSDSTGGNASTGGSGSATDTGSTGGNSDSSNQKPSTSTTSGTSSTASTAPGYIASVVSNPGKSGKPHGKNITEGGFDVDDSNNASFNSEIGSENDPGRKAEHDFQTQAQSASGGTGPRQYGKEGNAGEGGYGVLDSDQSL